MTPVATALLAQTSAQRNEQSVELPRADVHPKSVNPEITRAARQFEAIFVRMMLEPLQKTGESKKSTPGASAGGAYGSMVVDAFSDAMTQSGGVGLAHMIEDALSGTNRRPK